MSVELTFSKGLAGIVVDTTAISQVQGDSGRLIYRGIPVEVLAEESTFEECTFFTLYGKLPNKTELNKFTAEMKNHRVLPRYVEAIITSAPRSAHPMTVLQSAIAALGFEENPADLKNEAANIHACIRIIALFATIVARISRERRGLSHIAPKFDLSHAENFLYMINGVLPEKAEARMFDVALILHLDHDFNASTFAARVTASTETRISTSIASAIGALSGPLHGGANERVLAMANTIGDAAYAKEWVLNAVANKAKVMGFGHRLYRTTDPRAVVLREMLEKLVSFKKDTDTYDILHVVHDTMIEELGKKEKDYIWPNVDFWSGCLYKLLGIDSADFTPIFGVARVSGWCSHIIEMWRDNRIYRPSAKYIGSNHLQYTPLKSRK